MSTQNTLNILDENQFKMNQPDKQQLLNVRLILNSNKENEMSIDKILQPNLIPTTDEETIESTKEESIEPTNEEKIESTNNFDTASSIFSDNHLIKISKSPELSKFKVRHHKTTILEPTTIKVNWNNSSNMDLNSNGNATKINSISFNQTYFKRINMTKIIHDINTKNHYIQQYFDKQKKSNKNHVVQ
ncbi:uncharacterized protein KGF55_005235 [Candida pseudojiufengensis]|uniref:uncharacterized protein n=1 Tax=Candida pseudojiufengensis TaxID=497109 RepID=UPI00222481C2|nr:uncharacterized protein KGF55_005235 [Candida pseudojiufengensis]KAI5959591.1 hypothetical protein KGF55_005235 [Candida pseudojiufengensis]